MFPTFSNVLKTLNGAFYGTTATDSLQGSNDSKDPKSYWGTPLANPVDGINTPRFDALISSIHSRLMLLQRQQDPRCASFSGLTPNTFLFFVKIFPFVRDFDTPLITPVNIDMSVSAYYACLSIEYTEHMNASAWNTPLLTEDGLTRWIQLQLWTHPSSTVLALNGILSRADNPFVDASTAKPFLHNSIPVECLPAAREDAKALMEERLGEWTDILQSQASRVMQMQLQQQRIRQNMGLASQGAYLAEQQAWNSAISTTRMGWGQF